MASGTRLSFAGATLQPVTSTMLRYTPITKPAQGWLMCSVQRDSPPLAATDPASFAYATKPTGIGPVSQYRYTTT